MSAPLLEIQYLIDAINSLPGIGKKSATKIAYFLLKQDEYYIQTFLKRISDAKNTITLCKQCNNFTSSANGLCYVCNDIARDKTKLCVVSSIEDLNIIEDTSEYNGLYYVLWGEINLKNPQNLDALKLDYLIDKIRDDQILKEVIFANNLTPQGMLTAQALFELFFKYNQNILYTRIAFGLPYNSSINYADSFSISSSLKNRTKMTK